MLLGNVTLLHKTLVTFIGGAVLSCETPNFTGNEKGFGTYASEGVTNATHAIPNGYAPGYSWVPPRRAGGLASYTQAQGAISGAAVLAAGRNAEASAALVLTVANAQADQIVPIEASGSLTLAKADAALAAAVLAEAAGACAISVASAQLGGIFDVAASGTMTLTPSVTVTALAFMEAEAGGATPLSPEGLTEQLLDNSDIESGYSMREALRLILSSAAGKLSGAGTATITIRNVPDTKDRIVATVDSNGNRESVTYDVEA